MIRILDRYILKKFLSTFVFVVILLVLIILVIDIAEKLEKFNRNNLSFGEIFEYYQDFVPFIANLITPITVFIATVIVTAKMASPSEIIAILSSGSSFIRMLVPYLMGSIIIAGVSFYLTGWVIPVSNKSRLAFENQYLRGTYYFDKKNFHIQVGPNEYLYMQSYSNQANVGYKFAIDWIEGNELKEKLTAKRIEWNPEKELWTLKNWKRIKILPNGEQFSHGLSMDTTLIIHPKEFESDYRMYESMTIPELQSFIKSLESRGAEGKETYVIELYARYTSPFAVIILTFIGVIVSARKSRGGAGFPIALGFLMSFIFILFFIMAKGIAEAGNMHPLMAVWLPNIIFGIIGAIMYKTVPR